MFGMVARRADGAKGVGQFTRDDGVCRGHGGTGRAQASAYVDRAAATLPADDSVVTLSPFQVDARGNLGYLAQNTLSGSRMNTALKDTPWPLLRKPYSAAQLAVVGQQDPLPVGADQPGAAGEMTGQAFAQEGVLRIIQ